MRLSDIKLVRVLILGLFLGTCGLPGGTFAKNADRNSNNVTSATATVSSASTAISELAEVASSKSETQLAESDQGEVSVDLITDIDYGWSAAVVFANPRDSEVVNEAISSVLMADSRLSEIDRRQSQRTNTRNPTVQVADAHEDETGDPLESVNRFMFGFNEYLQDFAMRPIAHAYNDYFPLMVRKAVTNFLSNLSSPVTLANDLLQLEFYRAWETLVRITVNTTAGIGGMADVASGMGFEEHDEDFGQTLGAYGVGEGLYLVLPIFGPSSPRDVVGKFLVDPYFDVAGYWIDNNDHTEIGYARTGISALDEYAGIVDELEQIKKTSVDFYAAVRSLYRQKRESEIANGSQLELPPIPDYDLNLSPDQPDDPIAGVN